MTAFVYEQIKSSCVMYKEGSNWCTCTLKNDIWM